MDEKKQEVYLKGISKIADIPIQKLRDFAEENMVTHILQHPMMLNLSPEQLQKVNQLNEFMHTASTLKFEQNMKGQMLDTQTAGNWFQSMLGYRTDRERMIMALFDSQMRPMSVDVVASGTINEAPVYPRMFLKNAMENGATGVMVCHNHPGGSLIPSGPDEKVTERLFNTFESMGIRMYDHFIVAQTGFFSFREAGMMPEIENAKVAESSETSYDNQNYKSTSLDACINGVHKLTGIPVKKLNQVAEERGEDFLYQIKDELPLSAVQYKKLSQIVVVHSLWNQYQMQNHQSEKMNSSTLAGEYAKNLAKESSKPELTVLSLDTQNNVYAKKAISVTEGKIDPKDILQFLISSDANSGLLIRTSESSYPYSTAKDSELVDVIGSKMSNVSIKLLDYVVASKDDFHSMAESGLLNYGAGNSKEMREMDIVLKEEEFTFEWTRD